MQYSETSDPLARFETSEDGEDSLLALVRAAKATVAAKKEVDRARDRAKVGRATNADNELVKRWETEHHWVPRATIALFERQTCTCGHHYTTLRGFYEEQTPADAAGANTRARRVVRIEPGDIREELPKKIAMDKWDVGMCVRCVGEYGFGWNEVQVTAWMR